MKNGTSRKAATMRDGSRSNRTAALGLGALEARDSLRRCPLFIDIAGDERALAEVFDACEIVNAGAGEVVFEEGSDGDALFIVWRGRVRIEKRTPAHDAYTVTILDRSGDFFGEMALIDRERRSATVLAEIDSSFLVMQRGRFVSIGDRDHRTGLLVTRRIAEQLSGRLRRAAEDIVTLFTALVREIEQRL